MEYDYKKIEKKWQDYWKENKTFQTKIDPKKPKFYVLDMFPYPSGAGLHVGHVTGYTGTDIIARYKRAKGFNVLHPMGWDSFGLPAEQYAIKTGTHPSITTKENIETYKRQLESLGFSYDWSREIATSDPKYYKWTQWIFTKLYKKKLAYEAEVNVNFCKELGTVLANEEVENGKTKEGGFSVERMPLKQWILKITEYADRLISDLDLVDWPESLKKLQINWIGKSKGSKVVFLEKNSNEKIEVFTTRPETLFGATYFVLSPEHPLVKQITTKEQKKIVEKFIKEVSFKSDLERTDLSKEKKGVFTGAYVINPVNNEEIPVWISDYVLLSYGTGAVMAVPSHDERDFAFAFKYNLPVKCVITPDMKEADEKEIQEVLSGKRCWEKDGRMIDSENETLSLNGLKIEDAKAKIIFWLEENNFGKPSISYKLRDWLFSRQRYWGEPFPVLHFENGEKRVLDLDELPLLPPSLNDYKAKGDGQSPIAKVDAWVNIFDKKTNKKAKRETQTMPQWAGSCWYYLRFCDPFNEKKAWGEEAENYWMPVDLYVGGKEHAVLHLLYARFWHKVFYDLGLVHTKEPFATYRYQGIVTARSFRLKEGGYISEEEVVKEGEEYITKDGRPLFSQIEKMSKSKYNGVVPDDIVEEFGADTLRLYEMFMGPFDREKIWNTDAAAGCSRFLKRFFGMLSSEKLQEEETLDSMKLIHRLIDKVTKDIESMQFNTAIAAFMEFLNDFLRLKKYPKPSIKIAVQLLAPFAPHIAEEMWEILGEKKTISFVPWPKADKKYLQEDMVVYIIQVNGRLREQLHLTKDRSKEDILEIAMQQEKVKNKVLEIKKVIFVPNKLLNIVTK